MSGLPSVPSGAGIKIPLDTDEPIPTRPDPGRPEKKSQFFEDFRNLLLSDLFARVVVLLMFALLSVIWVGWQRAEQRADTAAAEVGQLRAELRHIATFCTTNERGAGVCKDGTFATTTTVAP